MSVATIKLLDTEKFSSFVFYRKGDFVKLAKQMLESKAYKIYGTMGVPNLEGEEVAEEVFDLTNNPSRERERDELYGQGRSVSVGDIINVDGVDYLCLSVGWVKVDMHLSTDEVEV